MNDHPPSQTDSRSALDRTNWVNFATTVLARDGLAGVRIESLARELNVTKGSFYWHFRDRQALLNAIIAEWKTARLHELQLEAPRTPAEAEAQIHAIIDRYSTRPDADRLLLELAIRDWARRDSHVANIVEQVDVARQARATRLFEMAGFAPEEARNRALLMFTHVFGLSMMMFEHSISEDLAARHEAIARLICRK
ncbi:MAG: TetR family transcriptional regulator [Candidatus Dactylopiibacterium carminicum]|uniref:TetR family transcriptional regulator n=1 Tax=Candidatus Dactylopiibacterium carminicum TaxID=857335 RepID=A0A272EU03_9RHOO|nr:TetR/AcrR family transcriptional regulator [Candidatus Dactylopiibacterium carminicum]KAF7599685.1 TetR/AcrR family transcriptional regulator [Candidatus Dactylopiibacterium carminicum]PAS93589.1 MAG: TetR family transcriptional regulator [Candidatus Dactylopiibacterium carminicum]PAS97470.1 MAG: TetR family transcriptional regulator [Candidatus Dactylopiibacterium carminicum]PAS99674.1 MAG: hypothetical protein BSR46_06855 [Candidatus Dactylopiibacterium carminicum]